MMMALALLAVNASLADLQQMTARFAPVDLRVDTSRLAPGDKQALVKLLHASRVMDEIFLKQLWSGNPALYARLQQDQSPLGQARLRYFWLNKGPWSDLDGHTAFLPDVPPRKPLGANFYPEDMTKEEFEAFAKAHPEARGFFSVIRRGPDRKLTLVPYSREYRSGLERAAKLLREAAALTPNASLQRFLKLRADAFLSNDYYASDVAWMDLDAPIDVTIGPYETYNDELFGYKAAFEAFITLRDDAETAKVQFFSGKMQDVENHLPIDPKYRNPKLGAMAPIRVVDQILVGGDAAHGVQTAAFNLPNDERVVKEKGSKRVMLKNVQEAKFNTVLAPAARRNLTKAAQPQLSFDAFFTHILAHEMTHGIGPHEITINGRKTSVRQELKDLYSAIEEAKADITGLFMLDYLDRADERTYTTFLASAFRTLAFGLKEAHARGMALQMKSLMDAGAIVAHADGTFSVNESKIRGAVRDLTGRLLTIEATGDYAAAKRLLDESATLHPAVQKAIDGMKDIPTDIAPRFVTADALAR
jgi:hypothetical protein